MPSSIPADAFPHIIDEIFGTAPPLSLLALRAACKSWRSRADVLLVRHLEFDGEDFRVPSSASFPNATALSTRTHLRVPDDWLELFHPRKLTDAVRVLDISPLPAGWASQPSRLFPAGRFRNLTTARLGRVLDYWEHSLFEVDRVVLPPPSLGGEALRAGHFDLLRKQVRRRIVVHVPPKRGERLFADLGTILRFGRASELVLIFAGPHSQDKAEGRGYALDGFEIAPDADPLTAMDVMWPHLGKGKLIRIDLVNTGRGVADWTWPRPPGRVSQGIPHCPSVETFDSDIELRHNEWRVWQRFNQQRHRLSDDVQAWSRDQVLDRAHRILRFMTLDDFRADVGDDEYRIEMCVSEGDVL